MPEIFDVLLLFALPASGKSELRNYLASLSPAVCRDELHLGETVQLDDYPYVHLMRRISQELARRGEKPVFFEADDRPMKDPLDWLTLIHLLNLDFSELCQRIRLDPRHPSEWLFSRFDAARCLAGAGPKFEMMPTKLRVELAEAIRPEAERLLADKNAGIPDELAGKTIVIEAARGGPKDATFPLPFPKGYGHSLAALNATILARASILYIRVTPEESWRKNFNRGDDLASSLAHCVPKAVMTDDYGCDDMEHLKKISDRPGAISLPAHGFRFHLPVADFNNMPDRTSFLRGEPATWTHEQVDPVHTELMRAMRELWENQRLRLRAG